MKEIIIDGKVYVYARMPKAARTEATQCISCAGRYNNIICSKLPDCGTVDFVWMELSEYRKRKLEEIGI